MSGFSFDPSRPPKPSAFSRLQSGMSVRGGVAPGPDSSTPPGPNKIFNEFSGSGPDGDGVSRPQEQVALAGLDSAVSNITQSSTVLGYLGNSAEEVERANSDAAEVSVKDLDRAVALAEELYDRIRREEQQARGAHQGGLSRDTVQRFLS